MIRSVKTNDLEPGMMAAADIKDRNGRVLITAGNEITQKHIRVLKAWGVTEVTIEGVSEDQLPGKGTEEAKNVLPKDVEEEMNHLFLLADRRHPAIKELYQCCSQRKMGLKN